MKIVIAPDKFKGSLSSFEACEAMAKGILSADKTANLHIFPMADGGDGFAEVLKHYKGGETISLKTVDPLHREILAAYQWHHGSATAIIEMAVASGLVLLKEEERDPLLTSTFGTGLLINDALAKGARKIILGLGGSATNDAGTGILESLGFSFLDERGNVLTGRGEALMRIKKIVPPLRLPEVEFEIACDVQNILYGEQGAAYVYSPQKGADKEMVKMLDAGLRNFAAVIKNDFGKDVARVPGAGAAGGIAAGLMGFFNVKMIKGIDMIIEASNIMQQVQGADYLLTGEGKIDEQSSQGKVVGKMAELANQQGVTCVAFCGINELTDLSFLKLKEVICLTDDGMSKAYAMENAATLLRQKTGRLFIRS